MARKFQFDEFTLDEARYSLQRGDRLLRLEKRPMDLLLLLVERHGELVTRGEIADRLWGKDVFVDVDHSINTAIRKIRRVLRDDPEKPRYVGTVVGKGYRFAAPVISKNGVSLWAHDAKSGNTNALTPMQRLLVVGRESVLHEMTAACEKAVAEHRQVLFITGEPGIGKTTTVQAFLSSAVSAWQPLRAAWGQCIQHYGIGEPYQPLLEALLRLCRQADGSRFLSVLERHGPTWLAQLPGLLTRQDLATLQRTSASATRERMLRELTNTLEAIAAIAPLVLWIDDLQWCDASTLDWIAAFAQRPEPTRILLIGTFRPPEITGVEHPLTAVTDRLFEKGVVREIALAGLDKEAVIKYLEQRCPPASGQERRFEQLGQAVQMRTAGNPLFVINVLGDLVARGLLVERDQGWVVNAEVETLDLGIPDDVRRTIDRMIERLPAAERELLEVASVVGLSFSVSAVSATAGRPLSDVERVFAALSRQQRFLHYVGPMDYPDGSICSRFEFIHALYRDVLYERVPVGYRIELHRKVGDALETSLGERAPEIAAELSMHFERSRQLERAGLYRRHAAINAQRRRAYGEARMHFERALALLAMEPAGEDCRQREALLRIGLGAALMPALGWGAAEVEEAYARARALCEGLKDDPVLFPALWGLWLFYWGRGPLSTAQRIADDLTGRSHGHNDPALLLQAHHACWATAFLRGDLEQACSHAAEGLILYDADRDAPMAAAYGSHDAGVCARYFRARALALRGRFAEAIQTADEGIAAAHVLNDPFSLALAHVFAASVQEARRDVAAAKMHAETALGIARAEDFRLMDVWAAPLHGWAIFQEGHHTEGLRCIEAALAEARSNGSNSFVPYSLGLHAECCLITGQIDNASKALAEALAIVARTGERFWEAELLRLQGEVERLRSGGRDHSQVEAMFLTAIAVARRAGARVLVLRASASLAKLWHSVDRSNDARRLMSSARDEFSEGLASKDSNLAGFLSGGPEFDCLQRSMK
jgi:DNA-binding winged helix-turn-helix (wHTH) protein/predicted ATPase